VAQENKKAAISYLNNSGETAWEIGKIIAGNDSENKVII
jgi:phosphoribosylaminoimidazole (AIR) synthetase